MLITRNFVVFTAITFLFFCFPKSAIAGDNDEEAYELKDIKVTAEKEEVPKYEKSVVSEEEVSQPTVGGSVIDALRNQAGVQLLRTSPTNSEGNKLRLRGFNETRLRIEVDGIPVQCDGSYGGGGSVHWSTLSTENVERIEVQRGAVSAKHGNTLGGVINVITKEPSDQPKTSLSSVYGSLDTWDSKFFHSAKAGPFKWSLAGSHFETDGYLRNNYNERNNISAQLGVNLPLDFEIGAGFDYSDMETGMAVYNRPDSPFYKSNEPDADASTLGGPGTRMLNGVFTWGDHSYADDENMAFSAFINKKFQNGFAKISYRLWNQERTEYYFDATNHHKKIYERTTEVEDDNWLVKGDAQFKVKSHTIEFGGEYKEYGWGDQKIPYIDTTYFHPSINYFYYVEEGFKGQPDNKQYAAIYALDTWRFHPDWDLEVGLRQEWFSADEVDPEAFGFDWPAEEDELDESHLDPRAALTWRPWKGGSATARFGIAHRYPTSPEHFWWYLNKGSGFFNTELKSEKARQYELGIEQQLFSIIRVTLRGYYYDIENYISSTFVAGVGSVVYNIKEVDIKGMEAEVSAQILKDLRIWSNFTWQDGDKSGDPWDSENVLSNELPDFPEKMLNFGIDYHPGRLQTRLSANYVSERHHFDGIERVEMEDYVLLNLFASYRFWENTWSKWELLLSVENILDEEYEEEAGYPMPGVTALGGLKVTF
jgi:outer membrane receptor protein involved in Fe transport